MLLLFLLFTLACGAPLIEELEEEEEHDQLMPDDVVLERLRKLGYLTNYKDLPDDLVYARHKRDSGAKMDYKMTDEEIAQRLKELGYLTNDMQDEEVAIQRHKRSTNQGNTIEAPEVVFDRSFIGNTLKEGHTVLNYLDTFGFLDAALDNRLGSDSMETSGSDYANNIRSANPIDEANIQGALKLFQEFNHDEPTGKVSLDDLMIMKLPRCGVPDVHPNYFSESQDGPSTGLRYAPADFYSHIELDGGAGLVMTPALKNKLVKLRNGVQMEDDDVQMLLNKHSVNLSKRSVDLGVVELEELEAPDAEGSDVELHKRQKRYGVSDMKWDKPSLTYHISSTSATLQNEDTRKELVRAFEVWTEHIPIDIVEVADVRNADIKIKFEKKYHGDKYPFDGSMGVLAHAFYPRNGEVHFDDDEDFTAHTSDGVNLYYTAAHEFGHSLGLKHSQDRNSLMAPYHPGMQKEINLKGDDVEGITRLYGKGHGSVSAMTEDNILLNYVEESTERIPKIEGRCLKSVDAALMAPDKRSVYLFSEDLYYKLDPDNLGMPYIAKGYPKSISLGWAGVPDNIDAAFANSSTDTAYFFKGDEYWRYDFQNEQLFEGYPKKTPKKLPQKLKAIVKVDSDTYFFDDEMVSKHISGSVGDGIKVFKNKKPLIDAAFPFFINGYIVAVNGQDYSVYKAKSLKPVPAYTNRPLSWDFGISVCKLENSVEDQGKLITKRTKTMCRAYGLLAGQDYNVNIPNICYKIGRRFDVKQLSPIYDREDDMRFFYG